MAARVETTVSVGGRDVTVIELTVSEIRRWLAELSAPKADAEVDVVDQLLFGDVALSELMRMTDISNEALADATPSELDALRTRCREVNAHFFALRERLLALGTTAMASMPPSASVV